MVCDEFVEHLDLLIDILAVTNDDKGWIRQGRGRLQLSRLRNLLPEDLSEEERSAVLSFESGSG